MVKRKTTGWSKRGKFKKSRVVPYGSSGSGVPPSSMKLRRMTGDMNIEKRSQICELAVINMNAGGDSRTAYQFALSDLPNAASYQSLYDQYRFKAVKFEINVPNVSYATGLAHALPGSVFTVIDTDDAVVPANNSVFYAHDSCKNHGIASGSPNKFVRWLYPESAVAVYQGAFTAFGAREAQWIDMAYPGTLHYGVKLLLRDFPITSATTGNNNVVIYATYYMEFRKTI